MRTTTMKPAARLAASLCVTVFAFFATGCYGQGFGVSWGGASGYTYGYAVPGYVVPFAGPAFHTHRPVRHKFIKPRFGSHRHGNRGRFSGHSRLRGHWRR